MNLFCVFFKQCITGRHDYRVKEGYKNNFVFQNMKSRSHENSPRGIFRAGRARSHTMGEYTFFYLKISKKFDSNLFGELFKRHKLKSRPKRKEV